MSSSVRYKGYRFPAEIIGFTVWTYYRFTASFRDVEELLLKRGIVVSYETVRNWVNRFGSLFAKDLRKHTPKRGDKWHMDEQCLVMNGKRHWLWRAIDADGYELDILVQPRRNAKAALKFLRKVLKHQHYVPRILVTDKLRSYLKAVKAHLPNTDHRRHKGLNNRIENAHQPTRLREKQMRKFKSPPQAQRFLSTFGIIRNFFKIGLSKLNAEHRRNKLQQCFQIWQQITLNLAHSNN